MNFWGKTYTRRQLQSYAIDSRQLADIRLMSLDDGQERGVRMAHVRTGSGFDFDVLIDRALDIGSATYKGIPLAWLSGTGAAHPSRYEPSPRGWLRTFHGGLLALCGLTQAGMASSEPDPVNQESLGLHGRIGTLPAYDVRIQRDWQDEAQDWRLSLEGTVDEGVLFGYKLRLTRRLSFVAGQSHIDIRDTVRNLGGSPAPLMILYHCNFGFPLISPATTIHSPALRVVPRDAAAEVGIESWHTAHEPVPDYPEQAFFHELDLSQPQATVQIINPELGLRVALSFGTASLGYLTQWKQMGFGDYTMGIEPANCYPEGRVLARERGRLQMLQPDEARSFDLSIGIEEL